MNLTVYVLSQICLTQVPDSSPTAAAGLSSSSCERSDSSLLITKIPKRKVSSDQAMVKEEPKRRWMYSTTQMYTTAVNLVPQAICDQSSPVVSLPGDHASIPSGILLFLRRLLGRLGHPTTPRGPRFH
ncbi:hypothetical protein P7K49_018974 [Saguinus oedipus]|uniref:Uncharacterized protein n=1 Tax=Saguinus oedipus TaxID=9490 RepID=A0ABQ9UW56_SAGOE|nr:hypothetical protein P7K49_018974 [Saguinus oedipus]